MTEAVICRMMAWISLWISLTDLPALSPLAGFGLGPLCPPAFLVEADWFSSPPAPAAAAPPASTATLNCHRSRVSPESTPDTTTTRRCTSPSPSQLSIWALILARYERRPSSVVMRTVRPYLDSLLKVSGW